MDTSSSQAVELIRSRMSIQDLVGRFVALKPSGRGRWSGLCPFHQEKTPSFHVDENKQLCYCFGCKKGGDIFSFLQQIENIDFREALEKLAGETGVELPEYKIAGGHKKETLHILELTQEYFQSHLDDSTRLYLEQRGLSEESIEAFGLGYAPNSWEGLIAFLKNHNVSQQEGVEAGVLLEKEGRYRDRFRNRLTFPILDPLGRIVAFTARALSPEDEPKYLNSPETAVFKKSLLLYGYPQARASIRESKRAIVVEGLFDAIALHQMGFKEAVAVLGSSLSNEQTHLLKRAEAQDLYLSFDGDQAGQKATLASLNLEVARQFLVYAVSLEGGKDPGDLLTQSGGQEKFRNSLERALPEVQYRFEQASIGLDKNNAQHKQFILDALLPRLLTNESYDKVASALTQYVVGELGISPRALSDYLSAAKRDSRKRTTTSAPTSIGLKSNDLTEKRLLRELDAIALLYAAPEEEFDSWCQYVEDHTWPPEETLLAEFMQVFRTEKGKARILKHFEQRGEGERLIDALMKTPQIDIAHLEAHLEIALARVREVYYEIRLDKLKAELKQNPSDEILKEITETQRAIEAERRTYKKVF